MEPLGELHTALDFARYEPSGWALAYFACAAIVALVLVLVLTGRAAAPKFAPRRAFAVNMSLVVVMLLAVGAVVAADDEIQGTAAARIGLAAAAFIGPSTLHFVCALLGWRKQLRAARLVAWGFAVVVAVIAVTTPWMVSGAYRSPWGYSARAGILMPVALFHLFLCMLAAIATAVARMRATTDVVQRHQLRHVIVAYSVGNLTFLDVLPAWGITVIPSSFVWLTASSLILTHAIRHHNLLGVPDIGWRAVAWAFTSTLAAVVAVAIVWATQGWIEWEHPLAAASALFVMFLAMRVYLSRVQPRIDDLFLRRRRDLERELDELSDRLLVLHTAEEIARAVARLLERTLYVKLVAFAIREGGPIDAPSTGGRREPTGPAGSAARPSWRVVASAWGSVPPPDDDDPFVQTLAKQREPVARTQAAPSSSRMFARYGAEVILPLASGDELIGVVAVGPRPDARPFLPLETEFLGRLRAAVAAPLAAARLYDRRHRLRLALEEKVAARSADLARALANLTSAQSQLVQSEKMATLGLVVFGVAAELEAAVDAASTDVPTLAAHAALCDDAAGARLTALPEGEAGNEVRGWVKKAKLDYIRRDVKPLVDAIAEGARRARAIAGDLRRFARAGDSEIEPVDLHRELDAALNLLRHDLKDRVELVRDYAEDLPVVECDRGPIGQVFINLLVNAAQAIDGTGSITLRTRRLDDDRVEISVRDTGKGIPRENLGRIFEPFFTTKQLGARGGTGLGLSISYGIVERHGGRISVESEVGKGTEFRVALPQKQKRRARAAL